MYLAKAVVGAWEMPSSIQWKASFESFDGNGKIDFPKMRMTVGEKLCCDSHDSEMKSSFELSPAVGGFFSLFVSHQ